MKIISGGQTGVDRAALDVAMQLGFEVGGWIPQGRRAEDGRISEQYPLEETPSKSYSQRTEWNVRDSDGTLIVQRDEIQGGTALTMQLAKRDQKPVFQAHPGDSPDLLELPDWISTNEIHILNVAGPRESTEEGIYALAFEFLYELLVLLDK